MDYKTSGVDIDAGEEVVRRIKPLARSTFTPRVLADIGLFGAFFDAKFPDYEHPVLVSSVDGVGTKLKIAFMTGVHGTVGQDLVNHCVNDILVCGAEPLYFMDYFATGKLSPDTAESVIAGFAAACRENGCALAGGETAEMPSMYADGEYDLAGSIVGVVEKKKILNGSRVQAGDLLLGLRSTGLHTNGYSLARAALLPKFSLDAYFEELGETLGETLLKVHRSYLKAARPLLAGDLVHALSHVTGGGVEGNTKRVVTGDLRLVVDWSAWEPPPIFRIIQRAGNIGDEEMRRAFNLGVGLIIIAPERNADAIAASLEASTGEKPILIGHVTQERA